MDNPFFDKITDFENYREDHIWLVTADCRLSPFFIPMTGEALASLDAPLIARHCVEATSRYTSIFGMRSAIGRWATRLKQLPALSISCFY